MNFLVKFFTFFSIYTKRIGICGNVGLIAGAIAGTTLSFLDLLRNGISLTQNESIYIALILTAFTWIINLFILWLLARLTLRSVALPSLINCLLTCFATVFLTRYLNAYPFAWLIGIIVGILIGMLLCRLHHVFSKLTN